MKKRIISLLLCCVLVAALIPTAAFAAEAQEITQINISAPVAYRAGGAMPSISDITVAGDAPYTVVGVQTQYLNKETTGPLTAGEEYQMVITLRPKDGYYFKSDYTGTYTEAEYKTNAGLSSAAYYLPHAVYVHSEYVASLYPNARVGDAVGYYNFTALPMTQVTANTIGLNLYPGILFQTAGSLVKDWELTENTVLIYTTEEDYWVYFYYAPNFSSWVTARYINLDHVLSDLDEYDIYILGTITEGKPCTVTFDMNGHGTQVAAQTVVEGRKAAKPADPTAEDYTFSGWYKESTFDTPFDFASAITSDTTVYAKWIKAAVPKTYVAQIGDDKYETVQAAIDAAPGTAEAPATSTTTIILIADTTENVQVVEGKNIILDLNGFVLSGKGDDSVVVNNGTLIIDDSSSSSYHYFTVQENGLWKLNDENTSDPVALESLTSLPESGTVIKVTGGVITGGSSSLESTFSWGGGGVKVETGSLIFEGGNIIGNTAQYAGGGIYNKGGSLTISGGSIAGNAANDGGGVYINDCCSANITDGNIIGNTAQYGGGIDTTNGSTLYITGGCIIGNTAINGGGVYICDDPDDASVAAAIITNATITGNTADKGGGVYNDHGKLTVGGTLKIMANTLSDGTTASNLELDFTVFAIGTGDNAPKSGMSVGVTKAGEIPVTISEKVTEGDKAYFFPDNDAYEVKFVPASGTEEQEGYVAAHLELVLKTEKTLTLAVTAGNMTYTGKPYNESTIRVSAAESDSTPVTGLAYTYTWYAADDTENALSSVPTKVGEYRLVVAVDPSNETYKGKSDAITVRILPAPVDNSHNPTNGRYSYRIGSGSKVVFISSAENEDFLRLTYKKKGGQPQTLQEGNDYTRKPGSIEVTLTDNFCNSLSVGEYEFAIVSKLPNAEDVEVKAEFLLEVIDEPACCESKITSVKEGEGLTLVLGGKEAGTFDIVKSGCGYKLYDKVNEQYVGFNTNTKTLNASEFTWNYDGGLYATTAKTTTKRFFFWNYTIKSTVKYYLTYTGSAFDVNTSSVKAQVIETVSYETHDTAYKNNGDDTHTKYCKRCGTELDAAEKHTFENGKCIRCGALDPDTCKVTDVEVTEKKVTSYSGWLFWARKTTKYQYTIKPIVQNKNATTVEYNYNGKWSRGTRFTADKELSEFNIRITDSLGNTTNWIYRNNDVFPEN